MFENVICETLEWGGSTLKLETGYMARQATASVYASFNDTSVLATVVVDPAANPEFDFVPLSVFYQEKAYAAGRIPGGFFKREGKPTENEVLISRLIDRPLRPLIDKHFRHETQVTVNLLSYDAETKPDILAIIAASAALRLSGAPFSGPVGAARIGHDANHNFVLNPTRDQLTTSTLDLVVAGTREGVLMVESEAHELPEDVMLDAVQFGHKAFQPVLDLIERFAAQVACEPMPVLAKKVEMLVTRADVEPLVRTQLEEAYTQAHKTTRHQAITALKTQIAEQFAQAHRTAITDETITKSGLIAHVMSLFKEIERDIVRGKILKSSQRIDGRHLDTIRPIDARVGVLPRAHGSALFTRGETQALVVTTLGTSDDEQRIDGLEGEYKETFMLHYNFPSFCVGEVGRPGSVGRREIGHGKLAWRAIHPLLPQNDQFPHTLRVVSEILESNGSSSMATVCGASLSLMDACVPLERPVSGIAMGLIKEGDQYAVLSDILGDEDNLGDMDFKVAGTQQGITALQMDIKILGISFEIMRVALQQAKAGREHILHEMNKAIAQARSEFKEHMPRMETLMIPKEKIREVIGSGGKVIREITEKTLAKIDISDSGLVKIFSASTEAIQAAVDWVKRIAFSTTKTDSEFKPEQGRIYSGTVMTITHYGAFVNFTGSRLDGLVHISEISDTRIDHVGDVLKKGDKVKVKVIGFDKQGKVQLSLKRVNQETGKEIDGGNFTPAVRNSKDFPDGSRSDGGRRSGERRRVRRKHGENIF